MENTLKYMTMKSFIAEIPSIVNYNNNAVKAEFDSIIDAETGYLKRSLVNKNGKVDAFWGVFKNLDIENLVFRNSESLEQAISGASLSHNALSNRIITDAKKTSSDNIEWCHDAHVIASGKDDNRSLHDRLISIESQLSGASPAMSRSVSAMNAVGVDNDYIDAMMSAPEAYFYSKEVAAAISKKSTIKVIKDMKDVEDLNRGLIFAYYDVDGKHWCKVTTERPCMLINGMPGQIVNLIVEQKQQTDALMIVTDRSDYKAVQLKGSIDPELTKISMICTGEDKWSVYNYSFQDNSLKLSRGALV